MQEATTINVNLDRTRTLVWGPSGSGKTWSLRTWPRPLLIADFDIGVECLSGEKDIYFESFHEPDPFHPQALDNFRKWLGERMGELKEGKYKSFALDSATFLSRSVMYAILGQAQRAGQNPQIQDYGSFAIKFENIMSQLLALPLHLVLTAHDEMVKDEDCGKVFVLPYMIGRKIPRQVGIWFREIYYAYKRQVRDPETQDMTTGYNWLIGIGPVTDRCKTSMGGTVFEDIEPPNFGLLLEKARKSRAKPETKGVTKADAKDA